MARKGLRAFLPIGGQTPDLPYISDVVTFPALGYRSGVFQAQVNAGDSVTLQGRIADDFEWVDILTYSDTGGLTEVVLAPQMRVVATVTSGLPVRANIGG